MRKIVLSLVIVSVLSAPVMSVERVTVRKDSVAIVAKSNVTRSYSAQARKIKGKTNWSKIKDLFL